MEPHPSEHPSEIADGLLLVKTDNDKLIKKVFGNDSIVGKIMQYMTNEPINHLELRLVNKAFNAACLRMIRSEYKRIRVAKPKSYVKEIDMFQEDFTSIQMNAKTISAENIEQHAKFLANVAKVKVSDFEMERVWAMADSELFCNTRHALFDILIGDNYPSMKRLVNVHEICPDGCASCQRIAPYCREYGPLQMNVLLNSFDKPVHFDILHVRQSMMFVMAVKCVRASGSREECLERLRALITPNISCDRLVVHMSVFRVYFTGPEETNKPHLTPRELIETMFDAWKVKRVEWRFKNDFDWRSTGFASEWTARHWLTELRFDRSAMLVEPSKHRLTAAEVWLQQESVLALEPIREENQESHWHLMSVIRKVLVTDEMLIVYDFSENLTRPSVAKALRSALKDFPIEAKGQRLTIRIVSGAKRLECSSVEELFAEIYYDSSLLVNLKRWELSAPEVFEEAGSRVGVRFVMKDGRPNNEVQLEVLFERSDEIRNDLETMIRVE